MNVVFEKLTQTLAANGVLRLGIGGDFFRMAASLWPVSVSLIKENRIIGTMAGVLAGDYTEGIDFDAVEIRNGATAQAITVQISGGGAGSDRVIGEVSIIDGGKYRTYSGQAFAWAGGCSASAGTYAKHQIYNPPGSTVNLVVKSFMVAQLAAGPVSVHVTNAALPVAGNNPVASKYAVGAASQALCKTENAASVTASPRFIDYPQFSGAGSYQKILQEPVVIVPGWGLVFENIVINTNLNCSYEWIEEAF